MQKQLQFINKIEFKYYYLSLLLTPSLLYLTLLLLAIKFTSNLASLLVLNVLVLVIFENVIPLISTRFDLESRFEEENKEIVKDWILKTKQMIVIVLSALILLIGMIISLSNAIEQWNWKYTSVVWLVYLTFALPISVILPPREEHGV